MNRLSRVDWLVLYVLVVLPIGALWLYVELDSWRRRRRDAVRRRRRPGYLRPPPHDEGWEPEQERRRRCGG